jgi:hypothetical protein
MALTWPPKKRAKIKLLILTGLERFIVFIANIKDSDVTVNGFLFEIKNGQKLPLKKGCPDELLGESPLRLNKAVMEIVRIGAESLNEKDQVPRPIEGNSGQNETESTEIAEADEGTPGENEMCGTPSIDDRDKTFSASMSASESKEIVDNSGKKNSNAINNDNSSNDNSSNDNSSNDNSSHRKDNENKNNIDDNNDDNDNTNNNKENGIKIIGGNSDNKNNSRNNNSYNNNNNNNNSNSNNNSASNSNNNDTNESKTEQEQENTGIASTILGWLKGNSSKNKLQTPSKEKHPNEPRQQVTTEQQPNRASVTPSDAEADEGIPGENEMCGTPSIDDKDKTVSASMSAFESKEIVDNSGRENSNNAINDDNSNNNGNSNNGNSNNGNINDNGNGHSNDNNNSNNNSNNNNSDINSHQNDNNNNNSKSKTGQEQEKTSTRTTSHGTSARRSSSILIFQKYLKDNSSKSKLQTLSNEKHPNEPQKQVTIEQQPNRASVTPSDEPAPLNDKGTQETEPGHDKSVLHRNNNGNTTNNNSKHNNINNTTPTTANNNNNSSDNIITNNNTKQNNSNNSSNGNNSDNNNKNNSNNNNNSDNNNTTTTDKNNANNSNNTDNNNNSSSSSSNNNNNNNTDNNNSNNSNAKNESKTRQEEKTGPRTKLEGTPVEGGGTAFKLLGSSSSLSSTRYLKSTCNSSKNKLQTPSNEEHSIEQQQTEQV